MEGVLFLFEVIISRSVKLIGLTNLGKIFELYCFARVFNAPVSTRGGGFLLLAVYFKIANFV